MKITQVKLTVINNNTAVKAIGSLTLDDVFAIQGIKIMETKDGNKFVAFPSREKEDGSYEDIAFPLNKELYHSITDAFLEEYEKNFSKIEEKNK